MRQERRDTRYHLMMSLATELIASVVVVLNTSMKNQNVISGKFILYSLLYCKKTLDIFHFDIGSCSLKCYLFNDEWSIQKHCLYLARLVNVMYIQRAIFFIAHKTFFGHWRRDGAVFWRRDGTKFFSMSNLTLIRVRNNIDIYSIVIDVVCAIFYSYLLIFLSTKVFFLTHCNPKLQFIHDIIVI